MKPTSVLASVAAVVAACSVSGPAASRVCLKGEQSKKSMTWGFIRKSVDANNVPVAGSIYVGCHSTVQGKDCNPIQGDTACKEFLPILCAYRDTAAFPQPHEVATPGAPYDDWAPEVVGTTKPVQVCSDLPNPTLTEVNNFCVAEFGPGWSVAEFHDQPAGFGFQAHGGIGNEKRRFRLDINDQSATCWDRNK